jgi:hypothetical protein
MDAQKQQHLVRAKSRPTYCPIGPYLTTGINPMDLDVWTKVNGHYERQGNTSDILFPVYEMFAYFFLATCEWFPATSWQVELHPVWARVRIDSWLFETSWSAASRTWAHNATKSRRETSSNAQDDVGKDWRPIWESERTDNASSIVWRKWRHGQRTTRRGFH